MNFNAFTAGVEPGGLRNKNDIKLLICYMLASVESGLTKEDIISVLQENGLANYFEVTDAFADLLENKNIMHKGEPQESPADNLLYTVTDSGKLISEQLDVALPISVRQRALGAALNLLAKDKREKENSVSIQKNERGYTVQCNISGGDMDLMSFNLYVPDMLQARMVKQNFQHDPAWVYRCMLAVVTGNDDLTAEIIKELTQKNK